MTPTYQSGGSNILPFPNKTSSGTFPGTSPDTSANNHPVQTFRKINPAWTVERLFGKSHWASKWVFDLCEADPQFLLHLIDQSPDYVHFICLVRLALLEQSADDENQTEYARWIRTQSRKKIIQKLYPAYPAGILGVLAKLRKTPLARKDYQRLVRLLADDRRRKHFYHVKRVRKADLRLAEMLESIPEQFQTTGVIRCVKTHDDYWHLLFFIKISQLLNLEITQKEITNDTRNMDSMSQLSGWLLQQVENTPFPPPPWRGNAWIKPVCSRNELRKVRDEFKNCVRDYLAKIVLGFSCLYVSARGPAVIEMTRDIVFGWEVGTMEGIDHRQLGSNRRHEITQAFAGSGFVPRMEDVVRGGYSPMDMIETWRVNIDHERRQHERELNELEQQ